MAITKHNNLIKRARAQVIGLIVEREDKEPLQESSGLIPGKRSHRNWNYAHMADRIYRDYCEWIYTRQQFLWDVTVKLVFQLADADSGAEVEREINLQDRCKLDAINEIAEQQITAARMEVPTNYPGAIFKTSFFRVECRGN